MTARSGRVVALTGILAAAFAAGACDDGPGPVSRETLENATFVTAEGAEILLAEGTAVGQGNVRYELLLTAEGDLDLDSETDAAAVLIADQGRERFLTLHALLSDGTGTVDVSARLLGDRIEVHRMDISEGLVRMDVRIRRQGEPVTAAPSVDLTRHFVLTDRGLVSVALSDTADAADPPAAGGEAGNGEAGNGAEAGPALYTHEWQLESFDSGDWSADPRALRDPVALRFLAGLHEAADVSGELAGFAGCNRIFGSFRTYEGEALRFFGLSAMRRSCREREADFEQRFLDALRSVRAFRVAGDRMTLAFSGGAIRFRAGGRLVPHASATSPNPLETSSM